jgi:hypothetical protein
MIDAPGLAPLALTLGVLMLAGLGMSTAVRGPARVLGLAVATGVTYGVTAGLMKVVAGQLRLGLAEPFQHWTLYAVCVIGPVGFLLSQNTFQQGRMVSPALAVITTVDPLVGVAIGVWWMGESAAAGAAVLAGELLAAVVIVIGIGVLARRAAHLVTQPSSAPDTDIDRPTPPSRRRVRAGRSGGDDLGEADELNKLTDSVPWAIWATRSWF